jgi:cell division protein FtsZ
MRGARGVLISITGGKDLTLYEVDEAATRIREEVDVDANIIVGATFDESLDGIIRRIDLVVGAGGKNFALPPEAAIGNGAAFSKGRDFGAWLGLVPRQIYRRPLCEWDT